MDHANHDTGSDVPRSIRTRAVHAGQRPEAVTGALTTPIFQTASFAYGSFERGAQIFRGEAEGYLYTRFGNPTVSALEHKLADLEGAEAAVALSSGMAAVSTVTLGLLSPGDELLFVGPLYGGTEALLRQFLPRFGITTVSAHDFDRLEDGVTPATRMIWVESPTNPLLGINDLGDVARVARALGAWSVADNTFATPYLTRPLDHGCDLVVHSTTKYIGGHGDAIGGAVIGAAAPMKTIRDTALKFLGSSLGPADASLFLRAAKTLPVRMEAHCDGAEIVADALRESPLIPQVNYPGLREHPDHALAACQMRRFGGIVSFEIDGGCDAAAAFLDALELFTQAVSVGDVDSLACHPATTLHSSIGPEARARNGITDGLVRLSVGIEDPHDLVADLRRALRRVPEAAMAR
ncbi:MAG: trans-sulfuration enzyme family protein [Solirubrobacteraceae bacterium]